MPIEKPLSNPGYIRPAGIEYKVKTNDTWESVANANGISATALVHFNCGTTNSAEVNWYLHHKVGCTKPTHDGKNWMFSSDASPGVIHIPPKAWKRPVFPHTDPEPDPVVPAKTEPSGVWFGFGVQGGGHAAIGGKDTCEACLYSLESYTNRFWMNIDGYRVGPGLGGSIGVVFVIATGARSPGELHHFKVGGWDFQANLGGKWGDLAKGAKEINMIRKFAKAGMIIDKTITIAKWEKIRDLILGIKKVAGINFAEKSVTVLPIPGAGTGAEISVFYGWGDVLVHGVTMGGVSEG